MTDDVRTAETMSLREGAERGIERFRQAQWVNPMDHLKIDLTPKGMGPWAHLYCPFNTRCNGRDPVDILCIPMDGGIDPNAKEWLPYTGPLPDSEEYKADVAAFGKVP